jgi:hypothetical protein
VMDVISYLPLGEMETFVWFWRNKDSIRRVATICL